MSSSLLIEESPLVVLPSLAVAVGLNEALILQQIHYWLKHKQADAKKYESSHREGHWWVYNSVKEWKEQFPFWSSDTIQRALTSLKNKGVVIVKQFNKAEWDRTNWYTIDYEKLKALEIAPTEAQAKREARQSKTAVSGNRVPQNAAVEKVYSAAVENRSQRQSLSSETSSEKTQRLLLIPEFSPAASQERKERCRALLPRAVREGLEKKEARQTH